MPARISEYCEVVPIKGAGRGVIASRPLTDGVEVLACSNVAAHVIFREYRKEASMGTGTARQIFAHSLLGVWTMLGL